MIVLDASVIVKWFQKEEGSDRALLWEGQHVAAEETIAVPSLLFYEVANVLKNKGGVSIKEAEAALESLEKLRLQIVEFSPSDLKDVFSFARLYNISIYDAVYAILAEWLRCQLITADRKLQQKLKSLSWIVLL